MSQVVRLSDAQMIRGTGSDQFCLSIPKFDIEKGQHVAVVGPSGSGKSTLLELTGLLASPASASNFYLNLSQGVTDIHALWSRRKTGALAKIRSTSIGYVMQHGGILPYLTVWDNVMISARLSDKFDKDYAQDICSVLGIHSLLNRYPSQLSVGQRQRAAIARAVVHRPELILADEPTSALDGDNSYKVMELLTSLCKRSSTALLCATHNCQLVEQFGFTIVQCRADGAKRAVLDV